MPIGFYDQSQVAPAMSPNQAVYARIMGLAPAADEASTAIGAPVSQTPLDPAEYQRRSQLGGQQADWGGTRNLLLREMANAQAPKVESGVPTQSMLLKALAGTVLARLLGDKRGAVGAGIFGGLQQGVQMGAEAKNKQSQMDFQRQQNILGTEAQIAGYNAQDQERRRAEVISEGRYQQSRRDKELADKQQASEKAAGQRQVHAATLLRQYGDAVKLGKEGNIRRAAQVLQSLADKYPADYGSYAPTREQVEADIEDAKDSNRQKAAQQWSIDLDRAGKTYGLINDEFEAGLLAKRKAIAERYDMSEDELGPVPTAKTVGFMRLEETVRANKAREGEAFRNHNLIDANAKKRIQISAGHLELAKKRVQIAQQNANTYRATAEGKAALEGAQKVWADANKRVIALNAKIAGEQDEAKRESLLAERDYWEGIKTQATMTADDARVVQGVVNQIPGFSNVEVKPFVPSGLPDIPIIPAQPKASPPKPAPKASSSFPWKPRK